MVKIRLRREGAKDRPYYRIVVADSRSRREGPYIEDLGTYDPMKTEDDLKLNVERADKWIGDGAQPSETVTNLIKRARKAAAAAAE